MHMKTHQLHVPSIQYCRGGNSVFLRQWMFTTVLSRILFFNVFLTHFTPIGLDFEFANKTVMPMFNG